MGRSYGCVGALLLQIGDDGGGRSPFQVTAYAATIRNSVAIATGRTVLFSRSISTMP